MKRIVVILVFFSALGFFFLKFQNNTQVVAPSESISQNVEMLRASGEISSDQENLMRLQLAIVDFIAVKHSPPESLQQLVPRYFKALPINPQTKKPFQYEKRGESYVILDVVGNGSEAGDHKNANGDRKGVVDEFLNPNNLKIEDFVYISENKRDPFTPFDLSPKVDNRDDLPPLERYDLSQLKVSAILTDKVGGTVAIVEDQTGKGFTVKVGSRIGDKNGTVVSIDDKQLNVLEVIQDFTGETKQDLRTIKLQRASDPKSKKPSKKRR